jgi:hypothetical protein
MDQYLKSGLVSDSRVLDIRQVEVQSGKLLDVADATLPVFVVTFSTQEVLLFRNAKTREAVVGREDRVEQCMYAAVLTRVEEELDDELTGGWKVVEVCPACLVPSTCADGLQCRWRAARHAHTSRLLCLLCPLLCQIDTPRSRHITLRTYAPSVSPSGNSCLFRAGTL